VFESGDGSWSVWRAHDSYKFPSYRYVIPDSVEQSATLTFMDEVIEAVKCAVSVSGRTITALALNISGGDCRMTLERDHRKLFDTTVRGCSTGELKIGFNPRYLANLKEGDSLSMVDDVSPAVSEGDYATTIIMPMVI